MVFQNQDLWRSHPLISRGHRAAFPGLRIAVPIFIGYLAFDAIFGSDDHEAHTHGGFVLNEIGGIPEFDAHAGGHGHDDHHH
jgi:hypothetical protein